MRSAWLGLALLTSPAADKSLVYKGSLVTTHNKANEKMTCIVTDLGDNKWRGHFSGAWRGVKFSYKVAFSGPPEKVRGKARIDGANYEWSGQMSKGRFKGKFSSKRYRGTFNLKQQVK